MTQADVQQADELEELFDLEVPCDGRVKAISGALPCPHSNPAKLVKRVSPCGCRFSVFKCLPCYTDFVQSVAYHGTWRCLMCGVRHVDLPVYVHL